MLVAERHREILLEAAARGSVRVTELSDRFGVTEETVRRDLDKLQEAGKLQRTHGGAIPVESNEYESPHWKRERVNEEEKRAIAREAAEVPEEGDTLFLDASSTAWYLAKCLPDKPLVVVTNSSQVAVVLAGHQHVKVICIGGTLSPTSLSFVGPMAEENLQAYHANWAFLSCRAVDLERGMSDGNEQQARLRQIMIERSDRTCLMSDHSKFGKNALALIAPVESADLVITNDGTPGTILAQLGERVVEVRVARMANHP